MKHTIYPSHERTTQKDIHINVSNINFYIKPEDVISILRGDDMKFGATTHRLEHKPLLLEMAPKDENDLGLAKYEIL